MLFQLFLLFFTVIKGSQARLDGRTFLNTTSSHNSRSIPRISRDFNTSAPHPTLTKNTTCQQYCIHERMKKLLVTWSPACLVASLPAATVIHVINNQTNATSTITETASLPDFGTRIVHPTLDSQGVPITTLTITQGPKSTSTTVLTYPDTYEQYPASYWVAGVEFEGLLSNVSPPSTCAKHEHESISTYWLPTQVPMQPKTESVNTALKRNPTYIKCHQIVDMAGTTTLDIPLSTTMAYIPVMRHEGVADHFYHDNYPDEVAFKKCGAELPGNNQLITWVQAVSLLTETRTSYETGGSPITATANMAVVTGDPLALLTTSPTIGVDLVHGAFSGVFPDIVDAVESLAASADGDEAPSNAPEALQTVQVVPTASREDESTNSVPRTRSPAFTPQPTEVFEGMTVNIESAPTFMVSARTLTLGGTLTVTPTAPTMSPSTRIVQLRTDSTYYTILIVGSQTKTLPSILPITPITLDGVIFTPLSSAGAILVNGQSAGVGTSLTLTAGKSPHPVPVVVTTDHRGHTLLISPDGTATLTTDEAGNLVPVTGNYAVKTAPSGLKTTPSGSVTSRILNNDGVKQTRSSMLWSVIMTVFLMRF